MIRPVSVGLVVLVICASVAGISGSVALATAGPAAPSTAEPGPTGGGPVATIDPADSSPFVSQETQNFDNTTFEITIHENGSATWTFRHELWFSNEDNEREAKENFRTFVEAFEANETGLYDRFINQSRLLTQTGAQETGREMEATDFRRSARIEDWPTERGVVEMTFTWNGFAAVNDETIVAGDVFQDIYLSSDQAIVFEADGDLVFRSVEPDAEYAGTSLEETGSVQWNGQREFVDGRPRAVLTRPDGAAAGGGNAGLIATMTGADVVWYLVGGLLVAGAMVTAAVWYRRHGFATDEAGGSAGDGAAGSTAAAADMDGHGSNEGGPTNADDANGAAALSDEELMTDEDRVVKLIQENGGRMKQVNIVDETGWSKSKVSMLLSEMEDEGIISKLRVGRENIISLDGFEPEATKSPFEE
ncbi:DUF7343 domain-containing protein [Natrinema salsiterrestre]|uniref:HTH iclR-type domain-containing protein n=1 Tax=Natrinema salsiterrestre TaxID=2950540 RepID=A0A9Q4L3Y8_9EURY|nr:hypothetical protein [Natrinema salsiterrestre]MDF9746869.1 hypothetical protein [Natrinema salsiterrestre]